MQVTLEPRAPTSDGTHRTAVAKRVRRGPAAALSEAELDFVARIEGRRSPNVRAIAADLGFSPATAWRLLTRLKRVGALRSVAAIRLRDDACEAITYLAVQWGDPASRERLESTLRRDPCVRSAVQLSGRYDYRVASVHEDARAAGMWLRNLLGDGSIADAQLQFTRTLFDRPHYAAALRGSTAQHRSVTNASLR